MTPLSEDEKRDVVTLFLALKHSISQNARNTPANYEAFKKAYRGESRAFVDSFDHASGFKMAWVNQLQNYLYEEIEPLFWKPR